MAAHQRPRIRQHHSKVRTGCLTCRARRVKCDEAKPACRNCENRSLACGGYNTPRAKIFESWTLSPPQASSPGSTSTSSDASRVEPKHVTKRRKSVPKAKSGCLPCKQGHVKCDEARPSCLRCCRLNIECSGYPLVPRRRQLKLRQSGNSRTAAIGQTATELFTSDVNSDSIYIPPVLSGPYRTHEEQMGLKYWLVRSKLCDEPDSGRLGINFIGTHIPMLAWSFESLRHSIVAAGITCAALEQEDQDTQQTQMRALTHENKAISSILSKSTPVQATTLVAMMFFFTCLWSGKFDVGMSHLRHSLKLARTELKTETIFDATLLAFVELLSVCVPRVLQDETVLNILADEKDVSKQQQVRLCYVLCHFGGAVQWMEDAIRRAKLLRSERLAQQVRKTLEANLEPVRELLRRWSKRRRLGQTQMAELMEEHRVLTESPYAVPIATYNKFLTKDGSFDADLFTAQMKLTLRSLMLFAAGNDVVMRKEAVTIIKMGMMLQRSYKV